MAESFAKECTPLKLKYDNCFNDWYANKSAPSWLLHSWLQILKRRGQQGWLCGAFHRVQKLCGSTLLYPLHTGGSWWGLGTLEETGVGETVGWGEGGWEWVWWLYTAAGAEVMTDVMGEGAIERLGKTLRGTAFWHWRGVSYIKNLNYDFLRLFTWIHIKVWYENTIKQSVIPEVWDYKLSTTRNVEVLAVNNERARYALPVLYAKRGTREASSSK